jgi:hypothetical protein
MATNLVKLKRSAVSGKIPTTTDLELGELALNTHDGYVYLKKYDGVTEQVVRSVNNNDSATLTGLTLSNGTANGVAYLNGSKVLTTSGALTFDGTNLGITGSNARINWSSMGTGGGLFMDYSTGATDFSLTLGAASVVGYNTPSGWAHTWAVSGNEQMRLTSTGLGIGTSAPSYPLHVFRTSTSGLGVFQRSGGAAAYIEGGSTQGNIGTVGNHSLGFTTNSILRMTLDASGNLGIGTSSPTQRLDVIGNIRASTVEATSTDSIRLPATTANIDMGTVWGSHTLNFRAGGTPFFSVSTTGGVICYTGGFVSGLSAPAPFGSNNDYDVKFVRNNVEQMRLTSTGLGIGTNSPTSTLDVVGIGGGNGEISVRRVSGATLRSQAQAALGVIGTTTNHSLQFMTNNGGRMTITTAGNVGIGTSAPAAKLEVSDNIAPEIRISNGGGTSPNPKLVFYRLSGVSATFQYDVANKIVRFENEFAGAFKFFSGGSEKLIIDSAGNAGIGTSAPAQVLDVRGWGRFSKPGNDAGIEFEGGYGKIYRATASGNIIIDPQINSVFLNGNVGIGTATPGSKLAVNGSITESTDGVNYYNVVTQQDIGTEPNEIPLNQYLGSMAYQNADSIRVTDLTVDGNLTVVGAQTLAGNITLGDASGDTVTINAGTTTLTQGTANGVLYLNGSKAVTSGTALTFDGTNLYGGIGAVNTLSLKSTSGNANRAGISIGNVLNSDNGGISFSVPGTSVETVAVRISGTTGNVGIGTSAPQAQLHIDSNTANSVATLRLEGSNRGGQITFYNSTFPVGSYSVDQSGNVIVSNGAYQGSTLTERMRIDSAGNIGIGTNAPSRRLDVRSGSFNSPIAQFTGANDGRGLLISTFSRASNDDSVDYDAQYSGLGVQTWSINGAEKMRLDSTGNIGIGTSAPGARLQVNTGAAGTVGQIILMAASQTADVLRVTRPDTNLSLQFTPTGQLSIGDIAAGASTVITTGPSTSTNANLKVTAANTGNPNLFLQTAQAGGGSLGGPTSYVYFGDNNRALSYIGGTKTNAFAANASSDLVFGTTSDISTVAVAERMRITSAGNVGIGTTAPGAKLDVASTGQGVANVRLLGPSVDNNWAGGIRFYSYDASTVRNEIVNSTGGMQFLIANTERMRIDSAGNVGIGTSIPAFSSGYTNLSLNNGTNSGWITLQKNGTTVSDWYSSGGLESTFRGVLQPLNILTTGANYLRFGTNSIERLRIDSAGNLGIGTTAPAAKLQVEEVGIETTTTAVTNTVQTSVFSYPTASFRTAELMCQIVDSTNSQYHSVKLFIIHDGTNTWFNETNVIHSHAELGTLTVDILSGNVRLLFTATASSTKSIKVAATMLTS